MGSDGSISNGGGSGCIGGGSGDIAQDGITKLARNGGGSSCTEGDGVTIHGGGSGG